MDKPSGSVLDFFDAVEDPRQRGKVLYRLDEIMLVVLSGCLAGADNFVEMAGWARLNLEALRQIRPFARGVPSHDTLNDVVNALDPGTFEECFLSWIRGDPAGTVEKIGGQAAMAISVEQGSTSASKSCPKAEPSLPLRAAQLEQEIGAAAGPSHLLGFVHAAVDQEVGRTFGDRSADPQTGTMAFGIVDQPGALAGQIAVDLAQGGPQPA